MKTLSNKVLNKHIKQIRSQQDNGIFYFLGNIPQHVTHAIPLYELIGGTVVVTSKEALDILGAHNVKSLLIDDEPELFLDIDQRIKNTVDYLNENAKVVFMYETFRFKDVKIEVPTIMMSHGIPIKDYWVDWKIDTVINNYTYIATLGKFMRGQLLERGVPEDKLIDAGLTRNDLIINHQAKYTKKEFLSQLPGYKGQPIVSYMPTYWGASSVSDTGLEILENISSKYYLIFKPHPQTPWDIVEKYFNLIATRQNLHHIPESNVDLLTLYKFSDVIIGDMSSVIADAILADKPVVFAYGGEENQQDKSLYHPIREVQTTSFSINPGQGDCTDLVIDSALRNTYPRKYSYQKVKERLFHNLDGNSRISIARFIFENIL